MYPIIRSFKRMRQTALISLRPASDQPQLSHRPEILNYRIALGLEARRAWPVQVLLLIGCGLSNHNDGLRDYCCETRLHTYAAVQSRLVVCCRSEERVCLSQLDHLCWSSQD